MVEKSIRRVERSGDKGCRTKAKGFLPSFEAVGYMRMVRQNRNPYNSGLIEMVGHRLRLHEKWHPSDFLCWAPEHPYDKKTYKTIVILWVFFSKLFAGTQQCLDDSKYMGLKFIFECVCTQLSEICGFHF
jgi:hypothetical protein